MKPKRNTPLVVSYRKASSLTPYARNSRTHSEAQIAQIAASIREFGFTQPILVDGKSGIVAGHGRLLAAKLLGLADVPVIELAGLTDAQKRAYVIADNKLALNAGWDAGMLASELLELGNAGFDLGLTGFEGADLAAALAQGGTQGFSDPDEAPEPPVRPIARVGDVWLLGRHRLVCGDCTEAAAVEKAMGGAMPHLMVTDPPYGVSYDANWRNEAARTSTGMGNRAIGAGAVGKVLNDHRADWREAWELFTGDVVYVWHGALHAPLVAESLISAGFPIRSQIIWDKTRLIIGRGHYHWEHEPCWYAVRKGANGRWAGDRKQTTVWRIPHQKSETGHSTQKPVECMKRPIENNSAPGDAVYEPFSGSGTTIIAADMTARACHAIELNPAYIDVAVRRWQTFTGKIATLEADGRSFGDVGAERLQEAA